MLADSKGTKGQGRLRLRPVRARALLRHGPRRAGMGSRSL